MKYRKESQQVPTAPSGILRLVPTPHPTMPAKIHPLKLRQLQMKGILISINLSSITENLEYHVMITRSDFINTNYQRQLIHPTLAYLLLTPLMMLNKYKGCKSKFGTKQIMIPPYIALLAQNLIQTVITVILYEYPNNFSNYEYLPPSVQLCPEK